MTMKTLLAIALFATSLSASADTGNGAMMGIGAAMQTWGDNNAAREREQRQQQYEIEREQRIAAERQYQREQQAEYARQDALMEKERQKERENDYIIKQGRILDMRHPDWREVISSKEYVAWGNTIPLPTRKALSESTDGEFISSAIAAFKEYKAKNNKKQSTKNGVHHEKF